MKTILYGLLLIFTLSCSAKPTTEKNSNPIGKSKGYVVFTFDIEPNGSPSNIKIVESVPERTFDEEAIKAIKRWKFKPKTVDGKAIKQFNMRYKIEFKLED